jgi:hypothetical protein
LEALASWTGSVDLKWTDTGTDVNQYAIERSTDGVTFDVVGTAAAGNFYFVDNTASAGVQYTYEIVALDASGSSSSPSNTVSVTALAAGDPDGQGKFGSQQWVGSSNADPSSSPDVGPAYVHSDGDGGNAPHRDWDGSGSASCSSNNSNGTWGPRSKWAHWGKRDRF